MCPVWSAYRPRAGPARWSPSTGSPSRRGQAARRTRHPGRATRTHGLRRLEWERPRTERHSFRTRPTELCRAGRSDSRPNRERRPPARRHTRRCGYAIRGTCRPPVLSIDPAHVIGADAHRRPGEAAGDLHRTERVQLRSITELSEGVVAVRRPKANKHGLVDMSPPKTSRRCVGWRRTQIPHPIRGHPYGKAGRGVTVAGVGVGSRLGVPTS